MCVFFFLIIVHYLSAYNSDRKTFEQIVYFNGQSFLSRYFFFSALSLDEWIRAGLIGFRALFFFFFFLYTRLHSSMECVL